jgi:MoaA/NifB/PqqE/SkfB family radical SAM enzyme
VTSETAPVQFGFYERLTRAFPSQVIVDVTELCNLECVHCPHPSFKKSHHYTGKGLDAALNQRLVDEVREHGAGSTQYIRYTGEGEPLIHPQGYQMNRIRCAQLGRVRDADDERHDHGRAAHPTPARFGCASDRHQHRRLHTRDLRQDPVKGDLTVTRANVLRLIEWVRTSGSPTKVVVSYIEQPENLHEVAAFERFWSGEGAHQVVVRRLHSGAGAVVPIADLLRAQASTADRYPCLYPWERIILNPRGELAFCPQDWVHGSILGDYHETTIRELWTGPVYDRLRAAHLANDFAAHAFCGQCPDWKSTRWPSQGRSYADMVRDFTAPPA